MSANTRGRKENKKNFVLYKQKFNFHKPFHIIVDGTFAHKSVTASFPIQTKLSDALDNGEIKLFTSPCIINELMDLGDNFKAARSRSQKLEPRRCGHQHKTVTACECIVSIVGPSNKDRVIVATQDRTLMADLSKVPASPVLTYENGQIRLLAPTKATRAAIEQLERQTLIDLGVLADDKPAKPAKKDKPTAQKQASMELAASQ